MFKLTNIKPYSYLKNDRSKTHILNKPFAMAMHDTLIHTATKILHNRNKQGGLVGICPWTCKQYLQQFYALCKCSSVNAGLAACSIYVALDSIMWLSARFIEGAQIHPGSCVAMVQLNSTYVCL